MKQLNGHRKAGICLLIAFALWTVLIRRVDVQPIGPYGSEVGFASLNGWFHRLTGVHLLFYTVTDWLGLVPIFVCLCFGVLGLRQWICRRRLTRVDPDLLLLGLYYGIVVAEYLLFEMVPVNYRPILIDGVLEASYPSSTTLLVISVMPTLDFQIRRRVKSALAGRLCRLFTVAFTLFMVLGRLISGVHWFTDIVGAVMLGIGSFLLYADAVCSSDPKENARGIS